MFEAAIRTLCVNTPVICIPAHVLLSSFAWRELINNTANSDPESQAEELIPVHKEYSKCASEIAQYSIKMASEDLDGQYVGSVAEALNHSCR